MKFTEFKFFEIGWTWIFEFISTIISREFPIDRIPSCLIFEFCNFGRNTAVSHWAKSQNRDFRVFTIISPWYFWSIEHNLGLYWKFGTLAGLGSIPQAQMAMNPIQKTFLVLRPFERALTCSILKTTTQVMLLPMLRKAYFFRKESWLGPESRTSKARIQNYGPYYWDAHTNGHMFEISAL
jgi:hypothetical protein